MSFTNYASEFKIDITYRLFKFSGKNLRCPFFCVFLDAKPKHGYKDIQMLSFFGDKILLQE